MAFWRWGDYSKQKSPFEKVGFLNKASPLSSSVLYFLKGKAILLWVLICNDGFVSLWNNILRICTECTRGWGIWLKLWKILSEQIPKDTKNTSNTIGKMKAQNCAAEYRGWNNQDRTGMHVDEVWPVDRDGNTKDQTAKCIVKSVYEAIIHFLLSILLFAHKLKLNQ